MFGFEIPAWAIGVGFIILAGSLGLGEVEELRSRLAELEDVQRRLGELEERMDFAERLLTKQREGERLAPPNS